jgi:hypothetical protein
MGIRTILWLNIEQDAEEAMRLAASLLRGLFELLLASLEKLSAFFALFDPVPVI